MSHHLFARMHDWQTVALKGPDARDFLQRLTSADFRKLGPGHFTPATLLLATGKIVAYFKAFCLEHGSYLLLAPPRQQTAEALEKMHFRENLVIEPAASEMVYLRILGEKHPPAPRLGPQEIQRLTTGEIWLNEAKWNLAPYAHDFGVVVPQNRLTAIVESLEDAGFVQTSDLEAQRIRAFDAASPHEVNSTTMPLEVALDDAVHENKGCYPGQEVIERIRSMGQPPRLLVQVRGEGEPPRSPAILERQAEVGIVTSVAADPFSISGGWVGLALVKRVALSDNGPFTVAGRAVTIATKASSR